MKYAALLLLLACGQAWATTWYVRPITAEYGAEDGSTYADAYDGFADITWGVGGVEAGDTLKVCGTFLQTSADTASSNQAMMRVQGSGSSGLPIIIDGDCSASGDLAVGIVDGDYTSGSVIRTLNNTYITMRNLDLSGGKDAVFTLNNDSAAEVAVARYIIIESTVNIHDVHTGATSSVAIRVSGTNVTIGDYSTTGDKIQIYDAGTDGILCYSCGSLLVDGANIYDISEDDTEGDCVQLQRNTDGVRVLDLDCDKRNVDSKHCVVMGSLTSQASITYIDRMRCLMYGSAVAGTASGVYAEGQTFVRSSYIEGPPNYGMIAGLNNSAKLTATGNIINGGGTGCFSVRRTSAGSAANIYNNTCITNGTYGLNAETNTAAINFINNSITGTATYGIYRGASGTVDSNNNVSGPSTPYSDNGVAGVAGTGDTAEAAPFVDTTVASNRGYRLKSGSALRRAGKDLNIGNIQDCANRAFMRPPSIGACEAASGDIATTRTAR